MRTPENIQMICLVRLMVSLGAALMTLVSSYGFLPIVGAAGITATALMLSCCAVSSGVKKCRLPSLRSV